MQRLRQLKEAIVLLQSIWHEYQNSIGEHSAKYYVAVEHTQQKGRPRFSITREQLEYLCSLSFTWDTIASMLGVSQMTIYRRCQEYGLLNEAMQHLNDNELQTVVENLLVRLPYSGESILIGILRGMGYEVTRQRLRHTLHHVDVLASALRWDSNLRPRRPYSVPGPNSLWHIGTYI